MQNIILGYKGLLCLFFYSQVLEKNKIKPLGHRKTWQVFLCYSIQLAMKDVNAIICFCFEEQFKVRIRCYRIPCIYLQHPDIFSGSLD